MKPYYEQIDAILSDAPPTPLPPPGSALAFFPSRQLREVPPEHLRPWPFPEFLDNPACRWLQTLRALYAMPISFPASLSPDAGMLLHALVRNIQPRVVVETGTFLGISTIWLAAALADLSPDGELHSFDAYVPIEPGPWRVVGMPDGRQELVQRHVIEAGLGSHVRLHRGWSAPTIRREREAGRLGRVQLAFLDGDHSERGVLEDFLAVEPSLETGGYIILHDTHPATCGHDGPMLFTQTVNQRGAGRYDALNLNLAPVNYGLSVIQRVG